MIMIITIIQIIPSAKYLYNSNNNNNDNDNNNNPKYLREGFPMITIFCQIDDSLGTG